MPGDLDPFDREYDFAEPLRDALEHAGLGTVTGSVRARTMWSFADWMWTCTASLKV